MESQQLYPSSASTSVHGGVRYRYSPNCDIGESKTNLIINYLPQNMTQEEVRSLFASIGDIESCKLVRDKMTGQSLGYGFVNYVREEDASRAAASFNGLRLQNKTIKVSFARPSNEGIKGANLYVSGIPKSMTQPEMEGLFTPFGQIITSRILSDNQTGLSKGVGFVRFDKKEEAEKAIQLLNGTIPAGCTEQITVKFANNPATNPGKNVLQEINDTLQIASLTGLMNPLAYVAPAVSTSPQARKLTGGPIMRAGTQGQFRYSPIASAPQLSATAPLTSQLPGQDYLTTQALLQMAACQGDYYAQFANPLLYPLGMPMTAQVIPTDYSSLSSLAPSTSPSGICLFVCNLCPDVEDNLLWQLFAPFGAVQSVKAVRDFATSKCKGYAFVTMASYEEAVAAITGLNGKQISNRTLQVTFKAQNAVSSLVR